MSAFIISTEHYTTGSKQVDYGIRRNKKIQMEKEEVKLLPFVDDMILN